MEPLKPSSFDAIDLSRKLQAGSAALFPTDTVPALAACPKYADQLWEIKRRPINKPLILMGASSEELLEWVAPWAIEDAFLMARQHWPGALTMVIPASGKVVDALNPETRTLGIRVPALSETRDLLRYSGALATTSANLAGSPTLLTSKEVERCFPELPLLGPLPWPISSGLASTVVAWEAKGCWQILRRGVVIP